MSETGSLLSGTASGIVMTIGVVLLLRRHRIAGLRSLAAGLTIDLLVTMVFEFASTQFAALVGFVIHLLLLVGVRTALQLERNRAVVSVSTADAPTCASENSPVSA